MATIEKRGDGDSAKYRVKVRIKGEKPRTRTFKRLTDAKAWAKAVETDLGRGTFVPTTVDRRRTVAELIDKYTAEELPIRQIPTPEQCAGSVIFFASKLAAPVTGQHLSVNGGQWVT